MCYTFLIDQISKKKYDLWTREMQNIQRMLKNFFLLISIFFAPTYLTLAYGSPSTGNPVWSAERGALTFTYEYKCGLNKKVIIAEVYCKRPEILIDYQHPDEGERFDSALFGKYWQHDVRVWVNGDKVNSGF